MLLPVLRRLVGIDQCDKQQVAAAVAHRVLYPVKRQFLQRVSELLMGSIEPFSKPVQVIPTPKVRSRPVYANGVVYVSTGFGKPQLWAVRVDGTGDVSDTHVLWKESSQIPAKPSPLLVDGRIYVLSDSGILTCVDAKDGKSQWRERIGGNYSASPALIGKQIYLMSHEGTVTVCSPGGEYKELAKFELEKQIMASPAVDGDAIIVRVGGTLSRVSN